MKMLLYIYIPYEYLPKNNRSLLDNGFAINGCFNDITKNVEHKKEINVIVNGSFGNLAFSLIP